MVDTKLPQHDRSLFVVLAALAFVYIAPRAVLVPLTHDEARTFFVYTLSGEFLPWLSHWDAGNHLLCTALGWVSFKALGISALALRLFNVLSFLVYAWYTWRCGGWAREAVVRWSLWSALLLAPVLIEFFALYRGYGMGIALLMMSLFHTVEAQREVATRHVLAALLAWSLATSAMLSLMVLWCAALALLLYALLTRSGTRARRFALVAAWTALGLLPLFGAALYGKELNALGLLYYGTPDGLLNGSLRSLAAMLFGMGNDAAMWPMLLVVGVAMLLAVWFIMKRPGEWRDGPLALLVLLFTAELVGRYVMGVVQGMPFPSGRTALHWLPIMVLLFATVIDRSAWHHRAWRFAALILALFPLRTVVTANLTHTSIWPEEAISADLLDRAARKQAEMGRPLLIGAYHQMPPQWDFARLLHHPSLASLSAIGFPSSTYDLLLIDTTYFPTPPGFTTIAISASGRQVLKERLVPLRMELLQDSVLAPGLMEQEYRTLWESSVQQLRGMELALDLELVLHSDAECLMTDLVVEVAGSAGEHLHYDPVQLRYLQRTWEGDTLRLLRRIPALSSDTKRVVCYLWDQRKHNVAVQYARVRVSRIQPDNDLRNP